MTWKVSGYAAEELIGFGASGEVWRGVEIATGEVVALKRLREVSEPARDRLRREAAVMAELDHPHLLRLRAAVRDTTDDATVETLVVDYAARGSLAALLRVRPRLTPGEVVTIIAPIAAALAYVHDEGLVHGDVAPANILFTSEGRPMLADLGIARALGADGPAAATPDYLDPVIARGGAPGQRSDVFSLAAVAFHALTGVPPWNASAPEDTISVARGGEPPDLASLAPDVPAELVETVRRGLALDPGARGSAAELALDVRCSCRPEPVDLADARASAVPAAARPAALTHEVRRPASADERGRHRKPAAGRRRGVWQMLSRALGVASRRSGAHDGLRALIVGVAALVAAGWLGVAWGGASGGDDPQPAAALTRPTQAAATSPQRPSPQRPSPQRPSPQRPSPQPPPPATPHGGSTPRAQAPPTAGFAAATGWARTLSVLDRRRADAFAAADASKLDGVYAVGSPARRADTATLSSLAASGETVRGCTHMMREVTPVSRTSTRVVLRVRQSMRPYAVIGAHGSRSFAASSPAAYTVQLRASPSGWRIWALHRS